MDNQIVNNIKTLGIDMITNAQSGHPGIVLSSANIMYTLYSRHLNINPNDPNWLNRDRFVLSAGHGSALLYATLFMAGYLELDDLRAFRKIDSKTPGHPELTTPGVDVSTGLLGEGFATAVGMALASKKLNQEIRKPKKSILEKEIALINHKVYVLCSDGDIMEGITSEAASIAGNLNLNNLIVLYDSNNMSLDSDTSITLTENVLEKFRAMNWNTIKIKNDIKSIDKAISSAKNASKPTIIEVKTILGDGSLLEGTNLAHGKILEARDIKQLKQKLNIIETPFYFNKDAREYFQKQIFNHMSQQYQEWSNNYRLFKNGDILNNYEKYDFIFGEKKQVNILSYDFHFDNETKEATRSMNQRIMKVISDNIYNFIGGSADLASSTGTYLEGYNNIKATDLTGKNILFGVRELAMGAILNGLSLYNYKVFGSTFLTLADFIKPSIRMSSLMNLPVTYIFSHDSINIGQDGPTHQPIEQLAMLRSTPNNFVYRPSDANELIGCWNQILNTYNHPSSLILSRQEVTNLETTRKDLVKYGAYIVSSEHQKLEAILIATGTEVHTAYYIARDLYQKYGIDIRVVSMPCMELYMLQSDEYKRALLPFAKTFVIEAGSSFGLEKFVSNNQFLITLDKFGKSGTKDEVLKYMNFDFDSIENKIINVLKQVY